MSFARRCAMLEVGASVWVGYAGIFVLLALLAAGVPIGVALALVALGGVALLISPEAALIKSGVVSFEIATKYELGVLPLFLLMAHLCFTAGASRDFFTVAARFIGHRRGGLALASGRSAARALRPSQRSVPWRSPRCAGPDTSRASRPARSPPVALSVR